MGRPFWHYTKLRKLDFFQWLCYTTARQESKVIYRVEIALRLWKPSLDINGLLRSDVRVGLRSTTGNRVTG
jgi:hypothetical protein